MGPGVFIALVSAVISLIYFYFRKKFSFFDENGFLYEKSTFPMGNLKGVSRDYHIVYKITELYEKFKGKVPASAGIWCLLFHQPSCSRF